MIRALIAGLTLAVSAVAVPVYPESGTTTHFLDR